MQVASMRRVRCVEWKSWNGGRTAVLDRPEEGDRRMDLLRFVVLLPLRLLRQVLRIAGWLLQPLVGRIQWTAPSWARAARRRPRRALGLVATLAGITLAGWYAGYWYIHRPRPPQPPRVQWSVNAPVPSTWEHDADQGGDQQVVHPLVLHFTASAAPIRALGGGTVPEGITMRPAQAGQWHWINDRTLQFKPQGPWAVGTRYTVDFDVHKAFAAHVRMARDHFAFATQAFRIRMDDGTFHQDPQHVKDKSVLVPLHFNYPVDPASLERNIRLHLLGRDGKPVRTLQFSVTYGPHKLLAWIHSERLALPQDPGRVRARIDDGVRAARGGDAFAHALHADIKVPGLYSLEVQRLSTAVADGTDHRPRQVLVMQVNGRVRGGDLADRVHAWILPLHRKPGTDRDRPPAYWDTARVGQDVLERATPLHLSLNPTANDYASLQSFAFKVEPGRQIYLRIDRGLTSFGGYVMGRPLVRILRAPDYPKMLRFVAKGSLLSLSGSKRLSIVERNMPGMRLQIGRVLPDQLQHLASLNQGSFSHPDMPYDFDEDRIVERKRITRTFAHGDPGKPQYTGIDLGPYLKAGGQGVFVLRLYGYDPAAAHRSAVFAARNRQRMHQGRAPANGASTAAPAPPQATPADGRGSLRDSRLIVITDLGLIVKRALDGSQDVFVQSIRSGRPVAQAKVSVLAVNGQTLYSHSTGADGVVHFPSLKGLREEKRPAMYVVTHDGDLSFLPIGKTDRNLDYSRFDVGGEVNAAHRGSLSGYLFSDRGLYRPGNTFHIGVIVRAADWSRSVAGMPLEADIVDPRGVTVKRVPLQMDASGFTDLSYTPSETAPTGAWNVNLRIVRDGHADTQIGTTTVQVKEFQPDRMKVSAQLSAHVDQGWVKPDQLKARVEARNLFGTPAADRRVEASLTLRPAWPSFRRWPGYHFYDIHRARRGYQQTLQDGRTDASGHASFDLGLDQYADATYQLYFLSRVHEAAGGRSVAAATSALVSSNDWLVGYKSEDDLGYVSRNAVRTVHLVAIDPHARAMDLDGLRAQLIRRRYVSVLTRQDSGVYKYQSHLKEIPVSEKPLHIPAGGLDLTLATGKPGSYALRILRASDRKEVNRIAYTVAGNADLSRSLERNAELQLSLDRKDYKPGDTIDVSIRAPYTGSGLITIERDKVYAHAWFHADTTSSVQHITLPKDFEGNGYVNVQFVRDPSSDAIFMSPLSYGVVPFSVNRKARRDPLRLGVPSLVKPGDTATFHLHSAHKARVVVFAVDEGILQVARYRLGDPLDFFFRKKMLQVDTAQILDLILPDFEKIMARLSAPGGGAEPSISRHLNPFKRKDARPVAYWSGIVDVDGDRDFHYTVPDDFNGTLRVMAVAVTPQRTGIAQATTTVRGDFVLSPNVPTTLTPGDEAVVSVGVANNLTHIGKQAVPVAVTLHAGPQLKILGPSTQRIALASMHEGVAQFRVRATDRLGAATLDFSAGYAGKSARRHVELSVRPATPYRTRIDVHRIAPGARVDVTGLRDMFDAYASRQAVISNLPVVLVQAVAGYLVNYDHYCSEQLVSAGMPQLVMGAWPSIPAFRRALKPARSKGPVDRTRALEKLIGALHARQNQAGGFGLWTATPDADPFVSDYVMQFLLEARQRGIPVPQDMIDAGNRYLRRMAGDDSMGSLPQLRQRAYAVYLLTRQGHVTTNDLASVQRRLQQAYPKRWKTDLAAAWLAASYKLMKQDDAAQRLITGPESLLKRKQPDEPYQYGYYYDPLTRDATVLYLLARDFPRRARVLPPRVFENIAAPLTDGHYNTLSAAMTLLALDQYAQQTSGKLDKLAILARGKDGARHAIARAEGGMLKAGTWSNGVGDLRFVNASDVPVWGLTAQGGYDRKPSAKSVAKGIEVVRRYTDLHGKPVTKIELGQEIEVHLRIRATGSKGVGNVAIVDLLPGGFEPVLHAPPSGNGQGGGSWTSPIGMSGSTWSPEYADVREDRVVIYGEATPDVREFVYRIRATNAGRFQIAPVYAESMYDRTVQARSSGGSVLVVQPPAAVGKTSDPSPGKRP